MDLTWGAGVASDDRWIGALAGAWLDAHVATHLVVRRGHLNRRRIAIPAELAGRVTSDGIYLRLSTLEAVRLPGVGREEPALPVVALGPRTRVVSPSGRAARLSGLRLSSDRTSLTHLIVRGNRLAVRRFLMPADQVTLHSSRCSSAVELTGADGLNEHRADSDIEREVWDALYGQDSMSPVDLSGIDVAVSDGAVTLSGNVRSAATIADVMRTLDAVTGVTRVEHGLVSDTDIELATATALAQESSTVPANVRVQSHLGRVSLQGRASPETVDAIVRAAGAVRGVRSVERRIEPPENPHGDPTGATGPPTSPEEDPRPAGS